MPRQAVDQSVSCAEAAPAIFLHGLWRSGSTFLWQQFRSSPGTLCYYEPLHHGLAKLTAARLARETASLRLRNGHPSVTEPYFAEFAPLIRRRGVRGYHASFAFDRFHLEAYDEAAGLQSYIANLVRRARVAGRVPVLGFNRAMLRMGWLRSRFDALNIYMERDPMAVWGSYRAELALGNDSYFSMWLRVLERNASADAFAPLCEALAWPPRGLLQPDRRRRRARIAALSDEEGYLMVSYLSLLAAAVADRHADVRLEADACLDPRKRAAVERRLALQTGLKPDLSGYTIVPPRVRLPQQTRRDIDRLARGILPVLADGASPAAMRRGRAQGGHLADVLGGHAGFSLFSLDVGRGAGVGGGH